MLTLDWTPPFHFSFVRLIKLGFIDFVIEQSRAGQIDIFFFLQFLS